MKKLYTLVCAALLTVSAFAQDFTATTYIGAFEPAPAAAWTDNWTNWDCQNTVYPATTITVNADITSNTTAGKLCLSYVTGRKTMEEAFSETAK